MRLPDRLGAMSTLVMSQFSQVRVGVSRRTASIKPERCHSSTFFHWTAQDSTTTRGGKSP
jgi:hypothetical protein